MPKVSPDAACTNAAHATITAMVAASDGASAAPILPTSTHSAAPRGLHGPEQPQPPAHPEQPRDRVRRYPARGPRHRVHRAKARRGGTRSLHGEVETLPEELGRHVLHDELDAVAVAVGEREHPRAVVADPSAHHLLEALAGLGSTVGAARGSS